MNDNQFQKQYSYLRVFKYYKAAHGNEEKTKMLYRGNLKIAEAFHSLLGTTEVILRNSLHCELTELFNDEDWISNQKSGFMISPLLTHENKKSGSLITNDYLFRKVLKSENKLKDKGVHITSGGIIAEQALRFWISFFDLIHYKILKGVPLKVCNYLPYLGCSIDWAFHLIYPIFLL